MRLKHFWFALVLIAALLALALPVQAMHSVPTVALNGQPAALYPPPQVVGGVVLLPVHFLAEALGAAITWDGATETVTVSRGGHSAAIAMGSALAAVDGAALPLPAPAHAAGTTAVARAATYFNSIRTAADMDRFLRAMPKGGDLHNHLSGAVFAETHVMSSGANQRGGW